MGIIILGNANLLTQSVLQGHCSAIARHWGRLWGRNITPRWVQKQMKAEEMLQDNFYAKFLKWLYSIEGANFRGSRLFVADILARFPLSDSERRKLTLYGFIEQLSKLLAEIITLAATGKRELLEIKMLEGQILFQAELKF